MIKEFCLAWEKNKSELEEYFKTTRQGQYCSYGDLVKLIFDKVINPGFSADYYRYNTDEIVEIDDGSYQGTLIFILHRDTYQPGVCDYVYTNTYYGSCSACDTLLGISRYDCDLPDEEQVQDYMSLCLHLLQNCKILGYSDKEESLND